MARKRPRTVDIEERQPQGETARRFSRRNSAINTPASKRKTRKLVSVAPR